MSQASDCGRQGVGLSPGELVHRHRVEGVPEQHATAPQRWCAGQKSRERLAAIGGLERDALVLAHAIERSLAGSARTPVDASEKAVLDVEVAGVKMADVGRAGSVKKTGGAVG